MNAIDIALGFLAGIVSCVSPEALLLFPLIPASAGAEDRIGIVAIAIGSGLSMMLWFAAGIGIEAVWLRRIICALLLLQGIALMNVSLVERFSLLTGGHGRVFATPVSPLAHPFRMVLLGLFVGANWVPPLGPTLGKASLMAADARNAFMAFGVLFAFGVAASVPWIAVGRIVRFLLRPVAAGRLEGMAGKRILGTTFVIVAILGITGLDVTLSHWMDVSLPPWTHKLATTF
jgi:cytochrome c-type biogenesis protein